MADDDQEVVQRPPATETIKAGGGSNYLADQRARFGDEMDNDPRIRSRLRAVIAHENESGPAVAESLMNRMSMTGGSLMHPDGGMTGGAIRRWT